MSSQIHLKLSILSLLMAFFVPSFVFAYFQHSSLFAGLLLYVVSTLAFYSRLKAVVPVRFLLFIFVLVTYLLLGVYFGSDLVKVFSSFFTILFMVYILSNYFFYSETYLDDTHRLTIAVCYYLMLALGILSLFYKFPMGGYSFRHGSVFPFAEYSHYAIAFCFFSLLYQISCDKNSNVFLALPTIILGLIFPNLTMVVVGLIQLFMMRLKYKLISSLLLFLTCIPVVYFFLQDYLLSRIVFDENNGNLSNLVYLQGAENAFIALKQSYGIGIGLQNMGIQEPGYFTMLIRAFNNGDDLNRFDGGFLASKLISEFGVLGVLFSVFVLYNFIRVCRVLWRSENNNNAMFCIYAALSGVMMIEFFVRGYGYFSPGFLLFLSILLSAKIPHLNLSSRVS